MLIIKATKHVFSMKILSITETGNMKPNKNEIY